MPTIAERKAVAMQQAVPTLLPAYEPILLIVRRVAREHGYAVGLHGSGQRDLDAIAVPWAEEAASAFALVEAVCIAVEGFVINLDDAAPNDWTKRNPEPKPHGRLAWSIHLMRQDGLYIDLSVMPRKEGQCQLPG